MADYYNETMVHYWFMWFVVIRRVFCIRSYFKPIIVRIIINTDSYDLICIIWQSKKWGLSRYISLILEITVLRKIVGFRLFFCRNSFNFKKYMRDHKLSYYFSYVHEYISGKVHKTWQIISLYYYYLYIYWSTSKYHIYFNQLLGRT